MTRRYATIAIVLHWLIAAAIVLQMCLAWRMHGPKTPELFAVTQLHKSIGITILALSLIRLAWRLTHRPPPLPESLPAWEKGLAHTVHVLLYVIMIGMPLTGWLMVSTSRVAVPTELYGVIPWPDVPGVQGAMRHFWHEASEVLHEGGAKAIYVLLGLHVAGALKHQLFSRDEPILDRMAPGAVAGRWFEPRLAVILMAFLAVVAFGFMVQPPRPVMAAAPLAPVAADEPVAPVAPVAPAAPVPVGPVKWTVLPGSTLAFATSWSGDAISGRFDRWTADVLFHPEALARSKVRVSVDLASVNTGDAQRDGALPSGDWFDVAGHPSAIFTAERFEKTGPDRYLAHGRLSLRGVTKPLALPFRLQISGDRARVSGVTTLDRTAFGVGQGEWRKTDQIPAKVTVRIDLTARRG